MKWAIIRIAIGLVFLALAPFDFLIQEWWQFGTLLVVGVLLLGVGLREFLREKPNVKDPDESKVS